MEYLVVKLGGELIEDPDQVKIIADGILDKQKAGYKIVVVHGGGTQINDWCERLHIPVKKFYGRRVTDRPTMEVMQAVVAGVVNPNLVSLLRKYGVTAAGLTGADANLTTSSKRKPLTYGEETIDFGLIGEIESVDISYVNLLTDNKITPVISCLTWSENEGIMNINADTLARKIAGALGNSELALISGVPGVYDHNNTTLKTLSRSEWQQGVETGWITTGMQPKLENGFAALDEGATSVVITNPEGWASSLGTRLIPDK